MSLHLDCQYAGMISSRVRNFKRISNGWNFSCPYCGDSKDKSKARGFLYKKPESLYYKCFNCDITLHGMQHLLSEIDRNLGEEYRVDKFLEFKSERPPAQSAVRIPLFAENVSPLLTKVSSLPAFHRVKKYVNDRQIPPDKHYLLYYTRNFKQFANSIDAEAFSNFDPSIHADEPRLVIPLLTKGGQVAGYQGRALEDSALKYMTLLTHENNLKVFGLDRVDLNYVVRVFEGPIDSLFIENSLATCGSRLDSVISDLTLDKERAVIVYDNEPRNPHTIKKIIQAVDNGFKVCIWPGSIKETDINAMVLSGRAPSEIEQTITDNTYQGLSATLAIRKWKKI